MAALLLVDGTNIVMRCAFGGEVPAADAVDTAARMIGRATVHAQATHLIVTFDSPRSWRKELAPEYKAHRTTETENYSLNAALVFVQMGWCCVALDTFEADDLIATIASRTTGDVVILSGDSDLLALVRDHVRVMRPASGGKFEWFTTASVREKYGVDPAQLADFKALVGEPGDNITGVRGIGPKKAAQLLATHGSLARLLAAEIPDNSNEAARVRNEGRDAALLAQQLATLRTDAPLPPILRGLCRLRRERAA